MIHYWDGEPRWLVSIIVAGFPIALYYGSRALQRYWKKIGKV